MLEASDILYLAEYKCYSMLKVSSLHFWQVFEMYLGKEQYWGSTVILGMPYMIFIVYIIVFRGI